MELECGLRGGHSKQMRRRHASAPVFCMCNTTEAVARATAKAAVAVAVAADFFVRTHAGQRVWGLGSWVALSAAAAGQTRKLIWQVILLASGLAPPSLPPPLAPSAVKMSLPRTAAMWQAWKSFGRHKHTLSQDNGCLPSAGCWLLPSWLFTRLPVDETLTSARHDQEGRPWIQGAVRSGAPKTARPKGPQDPEVGRLRWTSWLPPLFTCIAVILYVIYFPTAQVLGVRFYLSLDFGFCLLVFQLGALCSTGFPPLCECVLSAKCLTLSALAVKFEFWF